MVYYVRSVNSGNLRENGKEFKLYYNGTSQVYWSVLNTIYVASMKLLNGNADSAKKVWGEQLTHVQLYINKGSKA